MMFPLRPGCDSNRSIRRSRHGSPWRRLDAACSCASWRCGPIDATPPRSRIETASSTTARGVNSLGSTAPATPYSNGDPVHTASSHPRAEIEAELRSCRYREQDGRPPGVRGDGVAHGLSAPRASTLRTRERVSDLGMCSWRLCRLHFGMLDLGGSLRRGLGLGAAVPVPSVLVSAAHAPPHRAGRGADRAR